MKPVSEMSAAEREALKTEIAYAESQLAADKFTTAELELWEMIRDILAIQRRDLTADKFVRGGYGFQRYRDRSQTLEALIDKACNKAAKKPDRAMRHGLRRLLLDSLCRCLTAANIPLSPTLLLHNFDKLEYAIDQEFPGYIDAGMLCFVLTALPQSES